MKPHIKYLLELEESSDANFRFDRINANTSAQQNEQQSLLNAQQGVNNARVGSQSSVNAGNTALASTTMQGQHGLLGGVMNGIGAMFAGGGDVAAPSLAPQAPSGPMSKFGQFMQKKVQNDLAPKATPVADPTGDIALQNGAEALVTALGRSKTAPAQPQLAGGQDAAAFSSPDLMVAANGGMAATGGNVEAKPGQQAVKSGNSYDNDKIPAVLSEGEIVIPRSVSMGKDPVKGSAAFVAQVLAKRQAKG